MMKQLLSSPFMWLALSVLAYEIGLWIQKKLRTPLANPLLLATVLLCALLLITKTSVSTYNIGGAYISLFLTPATVSLAIPIYRKLQVLKENLLPILLGAVVGSIVSMVSVWALCRVFGLSDDIMFSLLPKSVTTPIGVEVSATLGGIPSITVIAIIITGLFGAMVLPALLKCIGITHPIATGISMGTASHAVGTARAITLGETEGAMSGLAIGIAGLATAIIASVAALFLT